MLLELLEMNILRNLTNEHIKSFSLLILFQWIIFSCTNLNNKEITLEIHEYHDSVKIIPSPQIINSDEISKDKSVLVPGKIQNYEGQDKTEKNLLSQIATYNSALIHGDKQNCVKYLYKDAIVYFRKYYHGFSDEAITDEFFKSIYRSYVEQLNRFSEHGIEFSMVIPNLTRKIKQGENIFIVFNITSNVCSESLYTHFPDYDQTLGISHNGGKNWCFITINEDTPNILRISNSEDIIDAVMGY